MRTLRRTWLLVLMLAFVVSFVGCGKTLLQKIRDNPAEWNDKDVEVKGKVMRVLDWGYTLNDGKAELPVIPKGSPPAQNKKVTIKATVKAKYEMQYGKGKKMPFELVLVEK